MDANGLQANEILGLALVRLLEIVGEAMAGVSKEGRAAYPGLPWQEAIGLRNRLIHGYHDVNLAVVAKTISDDLPALADELRRILG